MNRTLIGAVALLLMVAGGLFGMMALSRGKPVRSGAEQTQDDTTDPQSVTTEWLKEYKLTERSGKKFHSREIAGRVQVVNFFFSKCPTVCRTQTAVVKGLAKEFGPQGVAFLSITCDPEHDTPSVLSLYANEFEADPNHWLFLTGELPYIRRVGAEVYFLAVDKESHSEALVVLDKWGQIRQRFSWKDGKEIAEMKKVLQKLMAETERPAVK